MSKRINVSLPIEDLNFCKSRDLMPSRLLQERITQIRDGQSSSLRDEIKKLIRSTEIQRRRGEYMNRIFLKLSDAIAEKFGDDIRNEILEKI